MHGRRRQNATARFVDDPSGEVRDVSQVEGDAEASETRQSVNPCKEQRAVDAKPCGRQFASSNENLKDMLN